MSVKPEEQLGFVEEIPEFDFELPKLDDMLMSLMQRKDNHIVKAQQGLDEKDRKDKRRFSYCILWFDLGCNF